MKFVLAVLILLSSAVAQSTDAVSTIPDAPVPVEVAGVTPPILPILSNQLSKNVQAHGIRLRPEHRFFDRQAKIAFAISTAARLTDSIQTCAAFGGGAREVIMPTQSCRGIMMWTGISQAGQLGLQYWFHRRGNATGRDRWHKFERLTPYVFTAANSFGVGYSLKNFWLGR